MKHLTEQQIVLHYYGDALDTVQVDAHLAACAECKEKFDQLKGVLALVEPPLVPDLHESFEQRTWLRLQDKLPLRPKARFTFTWFPRWALATAIAVLMIGSFVAGRFWPRQPAQPQEAASNPQRVVLVAVGDHLERSQMLLVEIMNAGAGTGTTFSQEQKQARELLDANRLYRVSAQKTGDPEVAQMLDSLERVLAEVANSPSDMVSQDLPVVQRQIQSQDLLFKIRVLGTKVRQEEKPAARNSQNQRQL
ncbi:MAG TPA: hypothetical protein VKZ53_08075 [Candidatus Angelobacter sp.]|nr:hypothetical protein [Candidatus Angelobacter sp.]